MESNNSSEFNNLLTKTLNLISDLSNQILESNEYSVQNLSEDISLTLQFLVSSQMDELIVNPLTVRLIFLIERTILIKNNNILFLIDLLKNNYIFTLDNNNDNIFKESQEEQFSNHDNSVCDQASEKNKDNTLTPGEKHYFYVDQNNKKHVREDFMQRHGNKDIIRFQEADELGELLVKTYYIDKKTLTVKSETTSPAVDGSSLGLPFSNSITLDTKKDSEFSQMVSQIFDKLEDTSVEETCEGCSECDIKNALSI